MREPFHRRIKEFKDTGDGAKMAATFNIQVHFKQNLFKTKMSEQYISSYFLGILGPEDFDRTI